MITKEQALTAHDFHVEHPSEPEVGPRGGVTFPRIENWRRNGQTKTWKRSPERFQIPVKFGMYDYSYITERDATHFHTAEDCPLNKARELYNEKTTGQKIEVIDDTKTYRSPYLKDA